MMPNNSPNNFPTRILALGAELNGKLGNNWSMMRQPDAMQELESESLYSIGAKRSYVPALGEITWEIPQALADRAYYSCVCRAEDGGGIGYVRVPNYNYNKDAVRIYEDIIARFEQTTQVMVFDQVNNAGGSMFQMYALLSMLTDRPLALPEHQITIDEDYAAVAADIIADAELGEDLTPDERPPPERIAYARFVLAERAAGRGTGYNLSRPVHLEGVAEILPATIHYTKKIVVLINELTFSAGEFLAATVQDNRRATLFGYKTAGAGGCAKRIPVPSGNFELTVTWTIARRITGEYIENIGIRPDFTYQTVGEDFRNGHLGYRKALLAAINLL